MMDKSWRGQTRQFHRNRQKELQYFLSVDPALQLSLLHRLLCRIFKKNLFPAL